MATTSRALAFAARWFDAATVSGVFEPLVADWQREWLNATSSGRPWVLMRGFAAFVSAVVLSAPRVLMTPAPREVTNQIATRLARYVGIATAVLMIPAVMPMYSAWQQGAQWPSIALALFTIPSALFLAFPLSMAAGIDTIRRQGGLLPHVERAAALKLGLLAIAVMVIGVGWILPNANQGARMAMNPPGMTAPLRGMRELTLTELITDPDRATVYAPGTFLASRSTSLKRELASRSMMIALPIVLLWLRWRAYNRPRHRWIARVPTVAAAAASVAAMYGFSAAGWWLEREQIMPMGTTYWLPIAAFWMWGIATRAGAQEPAAAVRA